jgi:hyperosmotically inducible protein
MNSNTGIRICLLAAASMALIAAAVKAGILAEPGLNVLKIDVDTRDGQVTLTGSADSPENVQRATQVARSILGVRTVNNRLAVSSKG